MTGLIRNNFYTSLDNIKWYTAVMTFLGILMTVIYRKNPVFLNNFSMICILGYSINAIFGIQKEIASKWHKYKLTTPVTRGDIIKSYYICHILWTLIGILFASVWVVLSLFLHGSLADKRTDYLMVFAISTGIGLLTGAIFYPLYYAGKSERYEAVLITSFIGSILFFISAVNLINQFFAPMTDFQLALTAILLTVFCLCAFVLSYPLTLRIFRRRDY